MVSKITKMYKVYWDYILNRDTRTDIFVFTQMHTQMHTGWNYVKSFNCA